MIPVLLLAVVAFGGIGAIGAAAPGEPAQSASKAPLRVLVQTDEFSGDLAARRTSVTDLSAALVSKKKVFTVVESEASADVVIDVLDRTVDTPKVVIGLGTRPGQPPGSAAGPARSVKLRANVKYAGQEAVLVNKNAPLENQRGWKAAAEDLAKQIENWIAKR